MTEHDTASDSRPDERDLRMVEAVRLYYGTGLSLRRIAVRQSVSYQTVANDLARWNRERPSMPAELVQLAGDLTRRPGRRHGLVPNGPMLRHFRVSRGLTQLQLARQVGRDISTVTKAESNTIAISEVLANQLANALDVNVEEILMDDDIDSEPEPEALASLDTKKARPPTTTGPRAGEKLSRKHNNQ